MDRLFKLLFKHHLFFLFLFLELIALVMLLNNRYQRSAFINSANNMTGGYYSMISNVGNYLSLKAQNETLMEENAQLKTRLLNYPVLSERLQYFEGDSSKLLIPAQVISGQISGKYNYFMIDKGSRDGIQKEMGVIAANKVYGIVVNVSERYSLVLPIINMKSKISAILKRNHYKATLVWDTKDYRYAILKDIPNHLELFPGDTISSSGFSFYFPADMLIGRVEEYYHDEGNNFNHAKVKLAIDYDRMRNVQLIKNYHKAEQDSLINVVEDE